MKFKVNKGVLRPLEFKGLRATYIAVAAIGIGIAFIVYFILQAINTYLGIIVAAIVAVASIGMAFYLNQKFGQYGLQMFLARKNCIKYIGNNIRIYTILKSRQ
ncbi:MAG: DUF4133 domain-containing protein [Paludibacteraceae bacterium]|nr:DUF4133 domain-containing protein [Paludibacteraceae bacterium]